MFSKPLVGPALMDFADSLPGTAASLFEDTAQSSPDKTVHGREHVGMAVLEIPIPATQGPVHVRHDFLPATSIPARCLLPYPVLQLLQALFARPFHAPLE